MTGALYRQYEYNLYKYECNIILDICLCHKHNSRIICLTCDMNVETIHYGLKNAAYRVTLPHPFSHYTQYTDNCKRRIRVLLITGIFTQSYGHSEYNYKAHFPMNIHMVMMMNRKVLYEPHCGKTGLRGFRRGPTQTGLYSQRRWLEA